MPYGQPDSDSGKIASAELAEKPALNDELKQLQAEVSSVLSLGLDQEAALTVLEDRLKKAEESINSVQALQTTLGLSNEKRPRLATDPQTAQQKLERQALLEMQLKLSGLKSELEDRILRSKPDSQLIQESYEELSKELGYEGDQSQDLAKNVSSINPEELESTIAEQDLPNTEVLSVDPDHFINQVGRSVLKHATKEQNFTEIILAGGMYSRVQLAKQRPDIISRMEQKRDSKDGQPLNNGEQDKLFFSRKKVHTYGDFVILLSGEEVVNTGAWITTSLTDDQGESEVVVTDIASTKYASNQEDEADSELFLSVKNAQLIIPKATYPRMVKILLLSGYGLDWIQSHVHSYASSDALQTTVSAYEAEMKKEAGVKPPLEEVQMFGKDHHFFRVETQ